MAAFTHGGKRAGGVGQFRDGPSEVLQFRAPKTLARKLRKQAKAKGVTLSEYMRAKLAR